MPVDVEIAMAGPADMNGIATVLIRAMEPEMIDRFMVPFEGFEAAYNAKIDWAKQTYPRDIADQNKRIFKAWLKDTDHIVGFAVITYSDGNFGDDKPDASAEEEQKTASDEDTYLKQETPAFAPFYFGSMSAIHKKHMRGQKHVIWNSLHVHPNYQRKGIGTALLRWGFEQFGLEKEKVWIQTQMRGRNVYRKFGWVDIENFDIDLSRWGGEMRGFGMHRSPSMLRKPGKFERTNGIGDE